MNVKIISADKALIYQTYNDGDTELMGEPALLIEAWKGDASVSISSHENNSVLINHDSIPALIKILKSIYNNETVN